MNFLAHQYLSGDSEKVRLGNFIGDYIKGKKYQEYHPEIQKGILLHRNIDHFTDRHPAVLESSSRFKDGYKRYSGVVVDMVYDHFLAKNWSSYHTQNINRFVNKSHEILIKNYLILPKRIKLFLPFIIRSRRMESYASFDGLFEALEIMSHRTSLPKQSDYALTILHRNYDSFHAEFDLFMKDLLKYVNEQHKITVATPNGWHPNVEKQITEW